VGVLVVDNETHAYVGDGAQVRAGGNVVVTAADDTDVDVIAIGAGVGIGAAGIGAGVGVTVLTKDTRAWIGDALVDAKGGSAEILIRDVAGSTDLRLFDGSLNGLGAFGRAASGSDVRGVAVVAQSREDVLAVGIAGAGGFGAGIAGAVTVSVLDSDTRAYIDDGAKINATQTGAHVNQDVHVQATNDVTILGIAGAIGIGLAGLAGGVDVLGWEFKLDLTVVQTAQVGFIGIAVALLGRNTAVGIFLGALLFGALLNGTSTRNLDPSIFQPELATNLTLIIQGLIVLFVGADVLILYLWSVRRKLRLRPAGASP
jgi:hypothetical protein